jgi:hypothetical protein
VDMEKMKVAQMNAGNQARSDTISGNWRIRGCTSRSCGVGRGLRQGCSAK